MEQKTILIGVGVILFLSCISSSISSISGGLYFFRTPNVVVDSNNSFTDSDLDD
jgi:hypothetical protein